MRKTAFTLIELLVVIAIIAILAAILFPVFAQAKESAKKASGMTQIKQVSTGTIIYTSDQDDLFPLAVIMSSTGYWQYNLLAEVPVDWRINTASTNARHSIYWANSVRPYIKNEQMYAHSHGQDQTSPSTTTLGRIPTKMGVTYNGLISNLSTTEVGAPSVVTMMWYGQGRTNRVGQSLPVPQLRCTGIATSPCRFNPTGYPDSGNGSGSSFGSAWFTVSGMTTHWAYSRGNIFVRTDTSAKYLPIGTSAGSNANYFNEPFSSYDANGMGQTYTGCRPSGSTGPYYWCMFRPDRTE